MLALLLPLTLLVPQDADQRALMARIESSIALPKEAGPLISYGRNYAQEGTRVFAVYTVPPDPSIGGCEVYTIGVGSRPCTPGERANGQEKRSRYLASQAAAGESRWHNDRRSLPGISDGGCSVIDVEYDIASDKIVSVACHGG